MGRAATVRAAAARAVDAVSGSGRSLDQALPQAEDAVAPAERSLLRELVYGTVRWYLRLDAMTTRMLERPLAKRDRAVRALLAVGLYQLWRTRIPAHAAVAETVSAAAALERPRLGGLVNALLRRFQRESETLLALTAEDPAVASAHPAWLVGMLERDWPGRWRSVLEANNERAPMWLRVNRRNGDAQAYRRRLAAAAPPIGAEPQPGLPQALRLAAPVPVEALPGFAEGAVSVQDGAAQLAAALLAAEPGERVLDACAAPGGKAAHLQELALAAGGGLELTALDASAARLERLRENFSRLGLEAELRTGDASLPDEWWDGVPYRRILVDAPCSGSGVIRRHPDIKLLRRPADAERLAGLQRGMLAALWPLLAPGGRLVYATCSVLRCENAAVAGAFLASRDDARERRELPSADIRALMLSEDIGYQILPGTAGLDGFYYCSIEKRA